MTDHEFQAIGDALADVLVRQGVSNYLIILLLTWHFMECDDPIQKVEQFRRGAISDLAQRLATHRNSAEVLAHAQGLLDSVVGGVAENAHKRPIKSSGRVSVRNADLTPREWMQIIKERTRLNVMRNQPNTM